MSDRFFMPLMAKAINAMRGMKKRSDMSLPIACVARTWRGRLGEGALDVAPG
jgi:hypothetical protein